MFSKKMCPIWLRDLNPRRINDDAGFVALVRKGDLPTCPLLLIKVYGSFGAPMNGASPSDGLANACTAKILTVQKTGRGTTFPTWEATGDGWRFVDSARSARFTSGMEVTEWYGISA